jgi:putative acetyltransferase
LANDGHITAIYVRSNCLGQGIGSRLLVVVFEPANIQNIRRLYAEASEFSLRLFLKFGFHE